MSTHSGHEGIVKVGANTVAEVTGFSVSTTGDTVEDTELSDTWKSFLAGQNSWTANVECHWDETDTTGQGALDAGSTVTLNLYFEGDVTGDTYYTGSALITSIERSAAGGETIKANFQCQGSGALTESTV